MKDLFLIALTFLLLNLMTHAQARNSGTTSVMKIEGNCKGSLADGTAVSFIYFSDFDGLKDASHAALTFSAGAEGLLLGQRLFQNDRDIYSFNQHQLVFPDSTGNTSGVFSYTDENNKKQTVQLQCDVRDYTYEDIY